MDEVPSMPFRFDTIQIHGGHRPDDSSRARAVPIYQSTSFTFRDAEHAGALFAGEESGDIYSRISNPTNEILEKRVSLLEGGAGSVALASGSAATL